jgi:hypothetical protein
MIYTPKEFCQSLIRDALKIETTFEHLPKSCADCIINGYYKEMTDRDGKPFTSFKQFCEYTLPHGMELRWDVLMKISERTKYREIILAQEVLDEPLAEQGRPEGKRINVDNIKFNLNQGGTSPSYILRRLARDGAEDASKAELFKQVTKGTISAHKAALEAGYRTKKTPLEQAKMMVAKLPKNELAELVEFLVDQAGEGFTVLLKRIKVEGAK